MTRWQPANAYGEFFAHRALKKKKKKNERIFYDQVSHKTWDFNWNFNFA